jgi:hypothetical protein
VVLIIIIGSLRPDGIWHLYGLRVARQSPKASRTLAVSGVNCNWQPYRNLIIRGERILRLVLQRVVAIVVWAALFGGAGRLDWSRGWIYVIASLAAARRTRALASRWTGVAPTCYRKRLLNAGAASLIC